ncbi:MAG TPA: HEAT repeat domain-containing protein [Polyangia bacterium]|nr:HEAT repeat domain-containing protein [Polyangia bacterium]
MTGASIHVVTLLLAALASADAATAARPPDAGTSTKPPIRGEVEAALAKSGGVGELSRLASASPGPLMAIASDQAAPEIVRARALSALAYARGLEVQIFLENFVVARTPPLDATDRLLLRRAAVGLGWQGDARLVEVVAPLLENADADVRLDGAVALGLGRTRAAEAPLRARLAIETDAAVRRQIEASLKSVTAPR